MKKNEVFICDGRRFKSYDEVEKYCQQNRLRVTDNEVLRKGVCLIHVHGIDYAKQVKSIL